MFRWLVLVLLAATPASAGVRFRAATESWEAGFRHHHGGTGEFYMIETMGSGVLVFDYDGDGDLDLLWVDSGPVPTEPGLRPTHALLRNDGGRFVDVTAAAGMSAPGYGMGVTAGDVDGDGDPDVYLTAFGPNLLFRNEGNGRFTEVGQAAGVNDPAWGASAAFFDADRDGDLDLYVTNYVDFTLATNRPCGHPERGLRSYCHPDVYDGLPDRFYRNRGDGTFEDATVAAGLARAVGPGLGVVAADLDADGWTDVYVANDMKANFLFHNRGDGTFEEIGLMAGVALSDLGKPEAGMGVALGDLDRDSRPDLIVTHLDLETNAVYRNHGGNLFLDARFASGLAEPSIYRVGFGAVLADFDGDGDDDFAVANGHIIHNVEQFGTGTTYKQPNQVFENRGDGRFVELADAGLDLVRSSRGMAAGDLDGDLDLDLAISNSDDEAEVWENVSAPAGRLLVIDLAGTPPDTGAVGAVATLATIPPTVREVVTASSYMSQSGAYLTFGLGDRTVAPDLTVREPGRSARRWRELPAGRRVRLPMP